MKQRNVMKVIFSNRVRYIASLICLVFFSLSLAGCTATQSLPWAKKENLKVALSDIELQEIMALETIFTLKIRVINPDDTPREIRSLKCDLKINGEVFASGLSGDRQVVPPFGTLSVPVVVYTSKFAVVGSVIEMLEKDIQQYDDESEDSLNYELDGQLYLGKDGTDVFPFHLTGKIIQSR